MILPIYTYGQPVLRKVARDIDSSYPELEKLITDMWDTLASSEGIGLAAPQIGLDIRLVVIDLDVLKEIDLNDVGQHYIDSVLNCFYKRGIKHFAKLDIWNNDFVKRYNLHNPQSLLDKLVMFYLRFTKKWASTFIVKSIDYVLKKIY